jgi:pimeloyl-ACP methyl ester carboxylesterase
MKTKLVDYPFKSNFLSLKDKSSLHYLDEGKGDHVLLCVHGNPTWSYYFRHITTRFSQAMRVVVPDHLGCGLSSKPQDGNYSLENHIQNLIDLVEFLDLKKIHLLVHDWGGAIGMGLATRRPELIKSICFLNTAAFISENIPKRISFTRFSFWSDFMIRRLNLFAWPATFMTTTKKLSKAEKKGYLYPYQNYNDRIAIARFVQDIPMEENHPTRSTMKEIEAKLPSLRCPKMIIWGGKDFCFDKTFFDKWLNIYPDAEAYYFEDANHYVIEDKKEECMKLLSRFIGHSI